MTLFDLLVSEIPDYREVFKLYLVTVILCLYTRWFKYDRDKL